MKGRLRQAYTTVACGMGSLLLGSLNVWPSYTTLLYASNLTTPLSSPITTAEESLLGSLPSLGAMVGAAIAGTTIDRLGRRKGGIALSIPFIISWSIISLSTNITIILIARFLSGIGGGSFMIVSPVFISEVSDPSIRGALATTPLFLYCAGCILSNLLGWFFEYHTIIWINIGISILTTILVILVVESPVYLVRQRRDEEARQSIAKYRGLPLSSLAVSDEFSRLKQQIIPEMELTASKDVEINERAEQLTQEKAIMHQPSMPPIKMLCGLATLVLGSLNVWPSYTTLIYASNATTPLSAPTTKGEESLLGSLPSLGAMLGSAIAGTIIDRLGRRNGGIVLTLPCVVAWAIISVSTNIKMILAARFLSGVSGGSFLIVSPVFISEVSDPSIRGALAITPLFLYCTGSILSNLFGWFFTYHTTIWVNIGLSLMSTLLIALAIESPVYLLRQRKDEDARQSIAKYRGLPLSSLAVADEFSRLKQQIMPAVELTASKDVETNELSEKEQLRCKEELQLQKPAMSPLKMLFLDPVQRKALIIVSLVQITQTMMGVTPVQVFAKSVFMEADPSHADLYTVLYATSLLLGNLVATSTSDIVGRRILLISSSVLVCLNLVILCFLINGGHPFAVVFVILSYCFSFMVGCGSVPYVLLAELFAPEVNSIASVLIITMTWLLTFVMIALFPIMLSTIGIKGAFLFFASVALFNGVISYFIVPETKGLTGEEIQELMAKKQ